MNIIYKYIYIYVYIYIYIYVCVCVCVCVCMCVCVCVYAPGTLLENLCQQLAFFTSRSGRIGPIYMYIH